MKLQFLNLKQRYNLKDYKFTLILLVLAVSVIGVFMVGSANAEYQPRQIMGRGIRSACHGCDLTDRLQVDPEFLLADVCGKYCLTSGCYFFLGQRQMVRQDGWILDLCSFSLQI